MSCGGSYLLINKKDIHVSIHANSLARSSGQVKLEIMKEFFF
jgi:hypothetical protein